MIAMVSRVLAWSSLAALAAAGGSRLGGAARAPLQLPATPRYTYTVVRVFPHDPQAFTQGLEYVDGFLYEGTGLNGRSSIREVELDTGEVVQRRDLGPEYFGEGITIWKSHLIELTWQSHVGFVYDRAS